MIKGSGSLTNRSGSERPTNMDPTDPDPQHWLKFSPFRISLKTLNVSRFYFPIFSRSITSQNEEDEEDDMLVLFLEEDEAAMFTMDSTTKQPEPILSASNRELRKGLDRASSTETLPMSAAPTSKEAVPEKSKENTGRLTVDDKSVEREELVSPKRGLKDGYQIPKLAAKEVRRRSSRQSESLGKGANRKDVRPRHRSRSANHRNGLEEKHKKGEDRESRGMDRQNRKRSGSVEKRSVSRSRRRDSGRGQRSPIRIRRNSSRSRRRSRSRGRRRSRSTQRQNPQKTAGCRSRSPDQRLASRSSRLRKAAARSQSLSPTRLTESRRRSCRMSNDRAESFDEESMSLESLKELRERMLQKLREEGEITSEEEEGEERGEIEVMARRTKARAAQGDAKVPDPVVTSKSSTVRRSRTEVKVPDPVVTSDKSSAVRRPRTEVKVPDPVVTSNKSSSVNSEQSDEVTQGSGSDKENKKKAKKKKKQRESSPLR
jgi:hypothetical protein